jgi:hypothetical protein
MSELHVAVEIRAGDRRCWRLSDAIDVETLRFGAAIAFDRGTHVRVRFRLPGGLVVETDAVVADEHGLALAGTPTVRQAIEAYQVEQEK